MVKTGKAALGVFAVLVTTALAILLSYIMAYIFEEDVHFLGSVLSQGICFVVLAVVYVIWFFIMKVKTRDQDLRHYRSWPMVMATSLVLGTMIGCVSGIWVFNILDYTAWVFFVISAAGLLLQIAGSLIAYLMCRPR